MLKTDAYVYDKPMALNKEELLNQLPNELFGEVSRLLDNELSVLFENKEGLKSNRALKGFSRALACSSFVQKQAVRFPERVTKALKQTEDSIPWATDELLEDLTSLASGVNDEATIMRILRQFSNQYKLRIAWQDLAGEDVDSILQKISALADALIQCAVAWAYSQTGDRFGLPRDEAGMEQKLIVIGMGKLGAKELNFSSDIDLIFCYPSGGETDGKRVISNEEFFTRMCRQVIKLLDKHTADGFVFRVDTRLRPFGESGALVLNNDAMELYYQSHAREWERYAMVKARLITGEKRGKAELMSMIKAFVFRRYLDYGVFDSIRVMKRQIEAQLQKKGVEHNVKLGPGGIREIEFIGQAFQLIRGGRETVLQERGILRVLDLLAEGNHIPRLAAEELSADYRYLRRLENHIQEIDDRQTHDLPKDEVNRARLVLSMDFENWDALQEKTQQVMARVHGYFESLIDFDQPDESSDNVDWLSLNEEELAHYFTLKEVMVSQETQRSILHFCQSYPVRQLQEKGQQYLVRLLPMLVEALLIRESHEKTLSLFLTMLEKICNRVVYIVLLVENTPVFNQLVRLSILSPWIVSQVTRSPILLDELIDPLSLFNVPTKEELRDDLDKALLSIPLDDTEGQMEALRIFKQVNVLRVAASDLTGVIPVMVVSDKLTDIAEVIVEKVVTLSWRSVCEQYGPPVNETIEEVSGFAVIAFGKMGGIELGFSSDLDIIFLHKDGEMDEQTTGEQSISLGEFYMRLGRKIISYMVTRTFSGLLYEMDLRLRPNGQSGLLVSSESAFEQYQQQNAWTWEHQALIRARFVAGCDSVAKRFKQIRHAVLKQPRDSHALRKEVIEMREKMRSTLSNKKAGYFDLKHGVGGIVDIEFIVQFGVLENANNHPALLAYTDNIRLLETLNKIGFLSDSQQKGLDEAYQAYRKASHHASLAENPKMVLVEEVEHHVQLVTSVWDEMIING